MTITKTETITKTQTLRDCKPIFQVSSINYPVVLSCGTVAHFERGNRKDNYNDRDNYKDKDIESLQAYLSRKFHQLSSGSSRCRLTF